MDYIRINDKMIPYPNGFTMQKEIRKEAAYTAMDGRELADIVGWKWADTQLKWDTLLDADLRALLDATAGNTATIEFLYMDGQTYTETAIIENSVSVKTRYRTRGGAVVWRDITLSLSFPITH